MNRSANLARLMGTTVLAGVFGMAFAGAAAAQTAPAKPPVAASDDALEEVVVTGTRIRRPQIESNNPINVISQREIALTGITDLTQLLQRQPQVGISNSTVTTNNTVRATGLSNITLRNLGAVRTLTLINGHRQVGGSASTTAVDIGTISPTMIERIDIVTGGSSAIYGADAIAGVVNFILKKNLEGVNYRFQYGETYHGGGSEALASISMGHNFDHNRGNVSLSVDYANQRPIYQYERDYATTALAGIPNPLRSTTTGVINVPATIAAVGVRGNVIGSSINTGNTNFVSPTLLTVLPGFPSLSFTFNAAGTAAIPFNRGTILLNNAGTAQTSSINCTDCYQATISTLKAALEREGVSGSGRYEFIQDRGWLRSTEFYVEGKYFHDKGFGKSSQGTFAQGSPTAPTSFSLEAAPKVDAGLPLSATPYPIKTDNAFIPANLAALIATTPRANFATFQGSPALLINRIDNDFGNREQKVRYDSGVIVAGFRGTFKNNWRFDTFLNYGQTVDTSINYDRNELIFFNQIDAVKNAQGTIVCRSTLTNPGNGCLPLNLFTITGNSEAARNQSYLHTVEKDTITQLNYQANISGDLFHYASLFNHTDLPIGFALGFEYRRETSKQIPDPLVQNGTVFGNFTPITRGFYSTKEGYGELSVPVLANLPFVKRLEFDISGRIQDFSTTGVDGTYGLSGNWQINDDFKARGVYSKAVRAPNINELFANGAVSFNAINDPCDGVNVNLGSFPINRRANCIATLQALGVNPFTGAGGAYAFTQTGQTKENATLGNPNLSPERAQTYTGGFVFTPHWMPGFTATIDYYDIKIKGAIASLGLAQITANCVDSPTIANSFCPQVTRDSSGNILRVITSVFNVASFKAKGVDFSAAYRFNLRDLPYMRDWGTMNLSVTGNNTHTLLFFPVAGDNTTRQQTAGDLRGPQPRFKADGRATWEYGPFTASYGVQYISSLNINNSDQPLQLSYERVPEYFSHDLRFEYKWHNQSAYVGINNFTDNDPPYVPGIFTGTGTSGALYGGPTGRYIYVGLSGSF